MNKQLAIGFAVLASCVPAAHVAAAVIVTIEAPTVVETTQVFANSTIVDFNAVAPGPATLTQALGNSGVSVNYDTFTSHTADAYSGALNTRYFDVIGTTATTITLLGGTATYFGLWASALDSGSAIAIYNGATLLYANDLYTAGNVATSSPTYRGNPVAGPHFGLDRSEQFIFFNFNVSGAGYDKIVLSNQPGGGNFESDDHTFGVVSAIVPEPAAWTLLITGFLMVGYSMRRRSVYTTA